MSTWSTVVVTGAAGGIGRAIVAILLDAGERVVAVDLSQEALDGLVAAHEGHEALLPYRCDVTDGDEVDALFSWLAPQASSPMGLVNLAGVNLVRPIEDVGLEDWNRILTTNLTSTFLCCRAAVPLMKAHGGGRIVTMSSIFGIRGEANEVAYCAAKAGVVGLTRALAVELAPYGITINAVAPVATLTPRVASFDKDFLDHQLSQIPLGRFGEASDVAATVSFLLSPGGAFYTGQVFSPNGGDVMR